MLRKFMVLPLAATVIALAAPTVALACRCVPITPREAFREAAMVIVARVEAAPTTSVGTRSYNLYVSRSWKGGTQRRITITSSWTSCSEDYVLGRTYLLYLRKTNYGLSTSMCLGNMRIEDAGPVLKQLGRANALSHPLRHGEGDRAKRGGGEREVKPAPQA